MKSWHRILASGVIAIAGIVAPTRPCGAIEPFDQTVPWDGSTYSWMSTSFVVGPTGSACWHGIGSGVEKIDWSGDNDYLVTMCATGRVGVVVMSYQSSIGDLDLLVFNTSGAYLGGSFGTSGEEEVVVGHFRQQAVVMKVVGYNGSTGFYSICAYCDP